jgi:uncharacterized protein
MKIQVGGLSEGLHTYAFAPTPTELGLPREFEGIVEVVATLEKTGKDLFLRVKAAAQGVWECDRCITEFRCPLSAHYVMYYVWEEEAAAQFDPSEVQLIPAGVSAIDITEDLRQTLQLAVPLKRLCRESCKGLCPQCGKNLNDGPCGCTPLAPDGRWDKLRELMTDTKHDAR